MNRVTIGFATGTELRLDRELAAAAMAACGELGVGTRAVASAADTNGVDLVVGFGFPYLYPVLFDRDVAAPRVAWLGEPLPPVVETRADTAFRRVPLGRVLDVALAATSAARVNAPDNLRRWRERAGYSYDWRRNVRVHREAADAGIHLVVTSRDRARSLERWGIATHVVPFGYHLAMMGEPADPADGVRDIDVLFLGAFATDYRSRRARIVRDVISALGPAIRSVVVENGAWGEERNALIRRAKVVLNVHRVPGNLEGIRLLLASAGGALVVSEAPRDPHPFVAGEHYVEVDTPGLADSVQRYLADDKARIAVARRAQAFVVHELPMRRSVGQLIDTVSQRAAA